MQPSLSRRDFLLRSLKTTAAVAVTFGAGQAGRFGLALRDQHETWQEARRPNADFLARHAGRLANLRIGGSFAPEQWPLDTAGQAQALQGLSLAVQELNLRRLRLGVRWDRTVDSNGVIDLTPYQPALDYCLANGVEVCLNLGPIRTFRWPEDHVPPAVLASLPDVPATGTTIHPSDPLALRSLDYLDRLLSRLRRDYGDAIRMFQVENEPFYPLAEHKWRLSRPYLLQAMRRVDAAFPGSTLLLTSAGRLNLHPIGQTFADLLAERPDFAGRLVSGFDFHFKTPLRQSVPVIRYFDQITYSNPRAWTTQHQQRAGRDLGFAIEVTEGQMEPYGYITAPGNSVTAFRFLLLRCLDKVLDPAGPALLRVWGVEELTKKMLRGELTDQHRQIIDLVQAINQAGTSAPATYNGEAGSEHLGTPPGAR